MHAAEKRPLPAQRGISMHLLEPTSSSAAGQSCAKGTEIQSSRGAIATLGVEGLAIYIEAISVQPLRRRSLQAGQFQGLRVAADGTGDRAERAPRVTGNSAILHTAIRGNCAS